LQVQQPLQAFPRRAPFTPLLGSNAEAKEGRLTVWFNEAVSKVEEIQRKDNTDGAVSLTCHLAAPRTVLMVTARVRLISETAERILRITSV